MRSAEIKRCAPPANDDGMQMHADHELVWQAIKPSYRARATISSLPLTIR